jgi:hypothetical protein
VILDGNPAEYLPKIDQEQLRKQFVPLDHELYTLDNFELFLKKRRELIAKGINNFLKSFYDFKSKNKVASDLEHYDQSIENIELAIRDMIDAVLKDAAEEDAYEELVPPHIRVKIKGKIEAFMAKNPGEQPEDYSSLRAKLNFFDISEYKETITNKQNWSIFQKYFGKPGVLDNRFNQLGELRNCIRHSRFPNEVTQKDGEASISWFESILYKSQS